MTRQARQAFDWPALPYDDWKDSKETLHLFLQIIGKIRLKAHPKLNHWWHVTLYPSPRGLTTGRIPYGGRGFEILFDMHDHDLRVSADDGRVERFSVPGLSVADFYRETIAALARLDIVVPIVPVPYENASKIPFADDHVHKTYDAAVVHRFWQILTQVASVFEVFRGRFAGKQTPAHLFWHSFDLAVTRFSGRAAPPLEGGTASDREAYSHEVVSVGFWSGDDSVQEPAFYAYAYPEPAGLADTALRPAAAGWADRGGTALALYRYDDMRRSADPAAALLDFLQSAYDAGAGRAGWPIADLTHRFAAA